MLPVAVAQSSSGRVMKSLGKGQLWRVFFPTVNGEDVMYSIAFGTHTKTAEPIDMSSGVMKGTVRYVGVTIYEGEGDNFGENTPNILIICQSDCCPCSIVHKIGADARLQALNESIIGREGEGSGIVHRRRSLLSTIALLTIVMRDH